MLCKFIIIEVISLYTPHELYAYLEKMNQVLYSQQDQITNLQALVHQLNQEVSQLKREKPEKSVHIDKIEYHFDQLKVEELKGTLSIGFSPRSLSDQIEELNVNGEDIAPLPQYKQDMSNQVMKHHPQTSTIMRKIKTYMEHQFEQDLTFFSKQHNVPIDTEFYPILKDDILNQVEPRIRYYCQQYTPLENTEDNNTQIDKISKQVIRDIHVAIQQFIRGKNVQKEGKNES